VPPGGGDDTERGFASFPEAARSVLALLEKQLPQSTVFLAHLDEADGMLRVIDARSSEEALELEPGASLPLDGSLCFHMASRRAPQLTGDAAADPVYGQLAARKALDIGSYAGAPLVLSDGSPVGTLCAISRRLGAFDEVDLELLSTMARLLAFQLGQLRREEDFERISESLRMQAATDPLTSLPNRRSFMAALEREWQLTRRGTASSYLVVADVDGLKVANDSFGHATGDALLKDVAHALATAARGTDIVGRIGGDEFGVLLVGCEGEREAGGYCRRACDLLERSMEGRTARARVSLGYRGLADSSSAAQALHLADQAMYARKASREPFSEPFPEPEEAG
jgi:diguanylate cyclase (GGDEF)-like protein